MSIPYPSSLKLFLPVSFLFIQEPATDSSVNTKPNVLLIISDDLNTKIGPYMNVEDHTPYLNSLAGEGVLFTNTYCQYPLCGPSRASLMSGLYPETNGILTNDHTIGSYRRVNPRLADHPSLAGFFRENGYFTARVSKIYHMGVPGGIERGEPGGDDPDSWDYSYNVMAPETLSPGELEWLSPGNPHFGSNFSRIIVPDQFESTQADYLAASQAIAILENRAGEVPSYGTNKQRKKKDSPFFLAVGFVRPHVPFVAPENCFDPYPDEEMMLPGVCMNEGVPEEALRRQNRHIWKMNELQKKKTISGYMASVRFMDQQVGRLLETLDRLDLRKNTIVIFISDHGYNLGEHDCWSKVSLWEGSVRVPMIISVPGLEVAYGKSSGTVCELIDLYPTLTNLCGFIAPPIVQGRNLTDFLSKPGKESESVAYTISYDGKAASIRNNRYRYTCWNEVPGEGNEELYDHASDPEEFHNLASDPVYSKILVSMREEMRSVQKRARR